MRGGMGEVIIKLEKRPKFESSPEIIFSADLPLENRVGDHTSHIYLLSFKVS